jgi:Putative 2/3 transmembrane domain holin
VKILKHLPRMTGWLVAALVLSLTVLAIAPQQIPVSLYKVNLIAIAGVIGYWLDRALFPYARPDRFLLDNDWEDTLRMTDTANDAPMFNYDHHLTSDLLAAAAMLRRALIVAAAMIAVGLGA